MAQRDKRFATAARRMLWHKQGAKCHYCGLVTNKPQSMWEIHGPLTAIAEHRIPLSRGGKDVLDNMVVACRDCDELKGSLTEAEFSAAVLWAVENGVERLVRLPGQHLQPILSNPAWSEYSVFWDKRERAHAQVAIS